MSKKDYTNKILKSLLGFVPQFKGVLDKDNSEYGNGITEEYIKKDIYLKDNKSYPETDMMFNGELYYLNPKVVDEIYQWGMLQQNFFFGIEPEYHHIEKVKLKIAGVFDEEFKREILLNELKKYQKKLRNNPMSKIYMLASEDLDVNGKEFVDFVKNCISNDWEIIYGYLIEDIPDLSQDTLFDENRGMFDNSFLLGMTDLVIVKRTIDFINNELGAKPEKKTEFTMTQQLFALEEIRNMDTDKWLSIPNTKKSKILSLLFSKNSDNIRKSLPLLEGAVSDLSQQQRRDLDYVQTVLNNMLG